MDLDFTLAIVIVALSLVLIAGIAVYYQFRRQWFEQIFEERRLRQTQYKTVIAALSEAAQKMDDETYGHLMTVLDSTILMSSPFIVLKIIDFQKFLRAANIRVLRNSETWLDERDGIANDLIRSMRYDIYGDEAMVQEGLSEWQPMTRTTRKPHQGPLEVIPIRPYTWKPFESESQEQK